MSSAAPSSSSSPSPSSSTDSIYRYDAAAIQALRASKPWENNVKFFTEVKISALAAMKMLKHALAGVEQGRKANSPPREIMGLMIGKPEGSVLVVLDACPLPVEGSETRVVADDAQGYMLDLMESLEQRRQDGFIGWYHSHPFDVESYSHCHLSATDVQTQLLWQNATPIWTAVVVDPLRSLAKQEPEFGAYRAYPPKYSPPANECPDGSIELDQTARNTRWGLTHSRYYSLPISYFTSGLGSQVIEVMSKNNLWIKVLASATTMETENRQRVAERVKKAADKLGAIDTAAFASRSGLEASWSRGARKNPACDELEKISDACCQLAVEQCKGHTSQVVKDYLFNFLVSWNSRQEARGSAAMLVEEAKK